MKKMVLDQEEMEQEFHIISFSSTNYYLLKCNDGFLLIDAGWVGKYEKFKKALCGLGIGIGSIKYILLTHHHHDHAALVQNIRSETRCRIIVHKDEVDYVRQGTTFTGDTRQFNMWLKLLDRLASPFIRLDYTPVILEQNDIIISDNDYDLHDLVGIKARVIHTPGHSKGSVSLLLENGTSFVGDVAMNTLKLFGQGQRPVEAEDYDEVYKSWKKLIRCGAETVYPSHGSSFAVDELVRTLETI
jgi:glyoxylase-like metal-dependent hydrolase (beta-lactamase superfamily II)